MSLLDFSPRVPPWYFLDFAPYVTILDHIFVDGINQSYLSFFRYSNQSSLYLESVLNFYDCKFKPQFVYPDWRSGGQSFLKRCLNASKSNVSYCYSRAEEMCLNSTVRMIKTIRITIKATDYLLNALPNLKIVHLMRDPRGVLSSRKRTGFLRNFKPYSLAAPGLCSRYMDDIHAFKKLSKKYPNRLKRVLYEEIATDTSEVAHALYSFLGLEFPPQMEQWISNHTSASKKNGSYGTMRTNSSAHAELWRQDLSHSMIKEIDNTCEDFYKQIGYQPF